MLMRSAQTVFLVLAIGFGLSVLAQSWDEFVLALNGISSTSLVLSFVLASIGTAFGGIVWIRFLAVVGAPVPWTSASRLFFSGQLGKYLPGGVWNFVAHGVSGRKIGLSPRTAAGAGVFLIYILTLSGAVVVGVGHGALLAGSGLPSVVSPILVLVALFLGSPPSASSLVNYILRVEPALRISTLRMGQFFLLGLLIWFSYGASLALLIYETGFLSYSLVTYAAAFAFAFIAGLFFPFAPAGIGVREAALVYALSDAVGPSGAVTVAVVSRLVHTIADFAIAGAVTFVARFRKAGD